MLSQVIFHILTSLPAEFHIGQVSGLPLLQGCKI